VTQKHPTIKSRVVREKRDVFLYEAEKNIVIDYFDQPTDIKEWYTKTNQIPFNFQDGPLTRFLVVSTGNKHQILVVVHHLIADGVGLYNLSHDLLLALDHQLDGKVLPCGVSSFVKENKLHFLPALLVKSMNKKFAKTKQDFSEADYLKFFLEYQEIGQSDYHILTFDQTQVEKMKSLLKKDQLTLNEYLVSCIALSAKKCLPYFQDKVIRMGVPLSFRDELVEPKPSCVGNYSSGVSINYDVDQLKSPLENAILAKSLLRKPLQDFKNRHLAINFMNALEPELLDVIAPAVYDPNFDNPLVAKVGSYLGESNSVYGIGVTNLGKKELGNFEHLTDAHLTFIPPSFPPHLLTCGVLTFNQELNLTICYKSSIVTQAEIQAFLLDLKTQLSQIALFQNGFGEFGIFLLNQKERLFPKKMRKTSLLSRLKTGNWLFNCGICP
ncbi:MAG: hypothetical protein EZS28_046485, partial [Streblomastix strix]